MRSSKSVTQRSAPANSDAAKAPAGPPPTIAMPEPEVIAWWLEESYWDESCRPIPPFLLLRRDQEPSAGLLHEDWGLDQRRHVLQKALVPSKCLRCASACSA